MREAVGDMAVSQPWFPPVSLALMGIALLLVPNYYAVRGDYRTARYALLVGCLFVAMMILLVLWVTGLASAESGSHTMTNLLRGFDRVAR